MLEAIIALLSILATILPGIVRELENARVKREAETNALIQRDLDVLHGPVTAGVLDAEAIRAPQGDSVH